MAKKKINIFKARNEEEGAERLSDKSYLDDFIPQKEELSEVPKIEESVEAPLTKRATIVVIEQSLSEFRDIIHTIKKSGHYEYTQKDAFQRAVMLLKQETLKDHPVLLKAPPPRKGRW